VPQFEYSASASAVAQLQPNQQPPVGTLPRPAPRRVEAPTPTAIELAARAADAVKEAKREVEQQAVSAHLAAQIESKERARVEERCDDMELGEQIAWELEQGQVGQADATRRAREGRMLMANAQRRDGAREVAMRRHAAAAEQQLERLEQLTPREALAKLEEQQREAGAAASADQEGQLSPRRAAQLQLRRTGLQRTLRARLRAEEAEAAGRQRAAELAKECFEGVGEQVSRRQVAVKERAAEQARFAAAVAREKADADAKRQSAAGQGAWRRRQQDKFLRLQREAVEVRRRREREEELDADRTMLSMQHLKFESAEDVPKRNPPSPDQLKRRPPWWVEEEVDTDKAVFFDRPVPRERSLVAAGSTLVKSKHGRQKVSWFD